MAQRVERLDSFNRYTIVGNLWSGINRGSLSRHDDGLVFCNVSVCEDDKVVLEAVLDDPWRITEDV